MHFVNYQQMIEDVKHWTQQLPDDLLAVVGIPRSGILPAALLALHFNVHLVTLEALKREETPWRDALRRGVAGKQSGRVLVVDDSVGSGETLRQTRRELQGKGSFLFAALYYREPHKSLLDFGYREIPAPRCFEWNLFHCQQMQYSCLDLDGVICADWLDREEESGPGLKRYLDHLKHARPKYLPRTYRVQAIVTARLEKYRPQTETWLRKNGVQYHELIMAPYHTAEARRAAGKNAHRKAEAYLQRREARLFIESDRTQAGEIARLAGRPVLCATTMEMFYS